MTLDTTGAVLEGIRISQSTNPLVYPPRSLVTDSGIFDSVTSRAEYCIFVKGQSDTEDGLYINDPNLKFAWVKNDSISRFSYDNSNRRWFPSPGSSPTKLGTLSNSPALKVPLPIIGSSSPFQIFLGLPRFAPVTPGSAPHFIYSLVDSFGNPAPGYIEILKTTGELNFSSDDISNPDYDGQEVYLSRQSFYDRTKYDGSIATINEDGSYLAYLNPIPSPTDTPLIRIGYGRHLTPVSFTTESVMTPVLNPGEVHFSQDTGKVLVYDSENHVGESIYYDGVYNGVSALNTSFVSDINVSSRFLYTVYLTIRPEFVGLTDSTRYIFWASSSGLKDYYLLVSIVDGVPNNVPSGYIYIDKNTGGVYMNYYNALALLNRSLNCLDSYIAIDSGTSVQVYRSGANSIGNPVTYDFYEYYKINNATVVSGITGSPFVFLPSVPLDDDTLNYKVVLGTGSSGTFTGTLARASDSVTTGLGYDLDFAKKQLSFVNRKITTKTISKPTSSIKLDDAAIIDKGVSVKRDGVPLTPGNDFDFNTSGGLISFLTSKGEADPLNASDIPGVGNLYQFSTTNYTFSPSQVNYYLLVSYGENAGFYKILSVQSSSVVVLDRQFPFNGNLVVSIKKTKEVICDRVWKLLNPPMKKLSIKRKEAGTLDFKEFGQDEYSIIPEMGQINLNRLSKPGDMYRINYISQDSSDEGVTHTDNQREEYLASKIRLELATYVPGNSYVTFNADELTIIPERGFKVIIDSVTADSETITFTAPNTLYLGQKLTSEAVYIDYWVAECIGGDKTFNTYYSPIVADYPSFSSGNSNKIVTLNGNLTDYCSVGSAIFVNDIDVYIILASSYDSVKDVTTVEFTTPIQNNYTGQFKVCKPIEFSLVTNPSESIANGSNSLTFAGPLDIKANYIITIDDSPFYVIAASYDYTKNKTEVTLNTSVKKNYILPVIRQSSGPVIEPSKDFSTLTSAYGEYPITLFRGGTSARVLSADVDYTISDGGVIRLTNELLYGQSLEATYVARVDAPAGTVFEFNYPYMISPDDSFNGLLGQDLVADYSLYSPDSFFYRIETILGYVPEVIEAVKSASNQSSSGPSIAAVSNLKNKDYGIPSLYFDEQKYGNLDKVTRRLLLFYNDFTNCYEDLLSNYDGRVIGGTSGRLRYDNAKHRVLSYSEVTNDIDDEVKLYDKYVLTGFFNIEQISVYGGMWETNGVSRLFPKFSTSNFVVNENVGSDNRGKILGNIGKGSLTGVSTINSAVCIAEFSTVDGTTLKIPTNGDATNLLPGFFAPMKVNIYNNDGSYYGSNEILAVTGSDPGPFYILLNDPISIRRGGIVRDNQAEDTTTVSYDNRTYLPGTDLVVDNDNGNLINNTYAFLVLLDSQREIVKNEILTANITYNNPSTTPKRIPVLDGSALNDYGCPSNPPLHRLSELDCLNDEVSFLGSFASHTAGVTPLDTLVNCNVVLNVGDVITFTNGPNVGQSSTVVTVIDPLTYTVSVSFSFTDLLGSSFNISTEIASYGAAVLNELNIIKDNVAVPVLPPAYIGVLNSELKTIDTIITNMGTTLFSGSGSANGITLTDLSQDFTVLTNCYIYIEAGPNIGLYKVESNTSTSITVSTSAPYYGFLVISSVSYRIISLYGFLTENGPKYLAYALLKNIEWYEKTLNWYNSLNLSNASSRAADVNARITDLDDLINQAAEICKSGDSLYDRRFLWIQQRTDRTTGFLWKQIQSTLFRTDLQRNLVENQQKILALQSM